MRESSQAQAMAFNQYLMPNSINFILIWTYRTQFIIKKVKDNQGISNIYFQIYKVKLKEYDNNFVLSRISPTVCISGSKQNHILYAIAL